MIYTGWGQSNSPGNEQLDFWGSAAADQRLLAQLRRDQGPGGRHDHQPDHLRQGPRRAGRGDQGARPGDDGEAVRHPELHHPAGAHRLLEPLRPSRGLSASSPSASRRSGGGTRRRQPRSEASSDGGSGGADPPQRAATGRRRRGLRRDDALGLGGGQDRAARAVDLRRPQISGRTSPISTMSTSPRRRAGG